MTRATPPPPAYIEPAPADADESMLYVAVRPPQAKEAARLTQYRGPVTGVRVVVLQPGGWRFDLRAAGEPRREGERMVVPVAWEHEWYLAQAEGREPEVGLVNVRVVFVERPPG